MAEPLGHEAHVHALVLGTLARACDAHVRSEALCRALAADGRHTCFTLILVPTVVAERPYAARQELDVAVLALEVAPLMLAADLAQGDLGVVLQVCGKLGSAADELQACEGAVSGGLARQRGEGSRRSSVVARSLRAANSEVVGGKSTS